MVRDESWNDRNSLIAYPSIPHSSYLVLFVIFVAVRSALCGLAPLRETVLLRLVMK
jgi:hypothetical protein